jgi:hypothetical protein
LQPFESWRYAGICQSNSGNSPLIVTAGPNPSFNHFVLTIKGGSLSEKLKLRVTDIFGRTVEQKEGLSTNSTITIGANYCAGIYFVKVTQGNEEETLKLIKLPKFQDHYYKGCLLKKQPLFLKI